MRLITQSRTDSAWRSCSYSREKRKGFPQRVELAVPASRRVVTYQIRASTPRRVWADFGFNAVLTQPLVCHLAKGETLCVRASRPASLAGRLPPCSWLSLPPPLSPRTHPSAG